MSLLIAPSLLAADFGRLAEEVTAVTEAGADWIHLDIMDGHFVPNLSFGPMVVKAIRRASSLPFDVHLMIEDPDHFAPLFRDAGADSITIHAESCRHLHRSLQLLREIGVQVGVSLNPHTPLNLLEHLLEQLDMVLLMTVNPGFGGQRFIPEILPKIKALRKMVEARGLDLDIQVDGGVNSFTARQVVNAGAHILVAGSAIFGQRDYAAAITAIRQAAETDGV